MQHDLMHRNTANYDYLIVGAGVIGTSTAYHLKRLRPEAKILLIERKERAGAGNTAKSAALYRNIFSSSVSMSLARASIHYYRQIADEIHLEEIGYLWLFSEGQWRASAGALSSLDPERDSIEFLDDEEIRKHVRLNTKGKGPFPDVSHGILGHSCGSLSAMALAEHYLSKFRESGGEVLFNTEIKGFILSGKESHFAPWDEVKVEGVVNKQGEEYHAGKVIVALGAWTSGLLTSAGIAPNIYPKKRQMFGLKIENPEAITPEGKGYELPAIILPAGGVYLKPLLNKGLILTGCADDMGRPFRMSDIAPEPEYFRKAIEPVMHHYFPDLRFSLALKWAGYYAYHIPDKNPVVEEKAGLIFVSGTSGSGIMKADSIGRIAASRALRMNYARLADGSNFRVSDLSLSERQVEKEGFII